MREHCLEVRIGGCHYTLPVKAGDIESPYKVVTQSGSEIVDNVFNEYFEIIDGNADTVAYCDVVNPHERPVSVKDLFIVGISILDNTPDVITCGDLTTLSSTDPICAAVGDDYRDHTGYNLTEAYKLPCYYLAYGSGNIQSITVGLFEPDITRFVAQLQEDSNSPSRHLTTGIPDEVISTLGADHFALKYYVENSLRVTIEDTEFFLPISVQELEVLGYTVQNSEICRLDGSLVGLDASIDEYCGVDYIYSVSLCVNAPESTYLYGDINSSLVNQLDLDDNLTIGGMVGHILTNTYSAVQIRPSGRVTAGISNSDLYMYNNYKLRVGD